MEKGISEKKFYFLVLIFLSLLLMLSVAICHPAYASDDEEEEEKGDGTVVPALKEDCGGGGDGTANFYEIRLIFPQFGGCYIVLDGDTKNPVYLQEVELSEIFWEVGKKEEYHNQPLSLCDPVVQEILDTLELVD